MGTSTHLVFVAALTCGALACSQPNRPSPLALTETVHAQESLPRVLELRGADGVVLISDAGADLFWNGQDLRPSARRVTLGTAAQPWSNVYLAALAGAGAHRYVCNDDHGALYSSATSCDGETEALRAEVAGLRLALQHAGQH